MSKFIKSLQGLVVVFTALFIGFSHTTVTHAETAEEAAQNIKIEDKKYGPYKDKKTYYDDIDVIDYNEQKKIEDAQKDADKKSVSLNPFSAVSNYFSEKKDDTIGSMKDMITSVFMMIVQGVFKFNIIATQALLTCLEASMNSSVVNFLIGVAETQVQAIAGIDHNQISSNAGIFGGLAGLAGLIAIAYVVYLYAVKRAPIESLKSLIQPLLAITISIMFISNFTVVLKGINNVTNDLTNVVSSATRTSDIESMSDSIQKVFIHRPWMYLEFGSDKVEKKRVEALLLNNRESKPKKEAIVNEVKNHNNSMLQAGSVLTRLVYVFIFISVNTLLSIPVWAIAGALVVFQVWFLLMACLAPFFLVWSILPNQFSVLRRYCIELLYPMALKVIVGFMALVVFNVSDLVFALPATDGLTGYYISTFLQIAIFFTLFFMRKRITSVFSATNGFVREMRQSTKVVTEPIKEGIQNTATIVGAGVGMASGNPQAAIVGAQLGNSIGKTVTGDRDALATASQLVALNAVSSTVEKRKTNSKGKVSTEENDKQPILHSLEDSENENHTEETTAIAQQSEEEASLSELDQMEIGSGEHLDKENDSQVSSRVQSSGLTSLHSIDGEATKRMPEEKQQAHKKVTPTVTQKPLDHTHAKSEKLLKNDVEQNIQSTNQSRSAKQPTSTSNNGSKLYSLAEMNQSNHKEFKIKNDAPPVKDQQNSDMQTLSLDEQTAPKEQGFHFEEKNPTSTASETPHAKPQQPQQQHVDPTNEEIINTQYDSEIHSSAPTTNQEIASSLEEMNDYEEEENMDDQHEEKTSKDIDMADTMQRQKEDTPKAQEHLNNPEKE